MVTKGGVIMKIVVVSDSHGKNSRLDEILRLQPDADLYVHCGDIETSEDEYPMYHTVMGNNDYFCDYPEKLILPAEGHQILVMHGNQFPYMRRVQKMAEFAKQLGCDIFCYGHTHVAALEEIDGVMMINPGSVWRARDGRGPSYAVIMIDGTNINAHIEFLD